jgi:hypothetical protein
MSIETINFNYLGLAIVFLLVTYYWLEHTKRTITIAEKKIAKNGNTGEHILVTTNKGEIEMDTNVFEHHMGRMKDNLVQLNQKFTDRECFELKEYLDKAKLNTQRYIDLNKNESAEFCNLESRYEMVDDYMLQDRELLRKQLDSRKTIIETDAVDIDEIRYSILELLIDIDIILFLMRSSMCKRGRFDMTSMDQVILELYNSNCAADGKLSQKIDMTTDKYVRPMVSSLYTDSSSKGRSVLSQDTDQSSHAHTRESFTPHIRNNTVNGHEYMSHSTQEEFSGKYYNETSMIARHPLQHKPNRETSFLSALDPREKNKMVDCNARYSLM